MSGFGVRGSEFGVRGLKSQIPNPEYEKVPIFRKRFIRRNLRL